MKFHVFVNGKQDEQMLTENSSTEDYYRINIAIPFVDHVVLEMSTRFHPDNRVGRDLFILVPAVCVVEKDLQGLSERLLFWEQDLPASPSLIKALAAILDAKGST